MLRKIYFQHKRSAPNAEALTAAIGICDAKGLFDGKQHRVFTRMAEHNGNIYLDLCDPGWHAVEISKTCWRVVKSAAPPKKIDSLER